ncbi:MAG: TRAP transporter substrate-binding protein [Formivibrio sp.]|nr:TRAP transporter substrate-binding protein [Formivibrio sp.]
MMSSNARRIALKATIAACIGASTFFMTIPSAIAAPIVKLRLASALPADANSSFYVWYEQFQSNLKASLKDGVEISYFGNGMLGKESDVVQQVRLGGVDMMISGTSIWATLVPELGVLDLGYLFKNYDHVGRALDGKAGETLSGMLLKKANTRILGYGYSFGARNVYSKKPIKTAADLQGMKIRVLPNQNFVATFKAMGASPAPMAFGEVYSGLQMGVIDGLEQDAANVLDAKFYEVAKYGALTQHVFAPLVMTINNNSFERLPAEYKAAFLKAAADATTYERKRALEAESKAFDELKKHGMTINDIDREPLRKAVMPLWTTFTKQYPDTKAIVDGVEATR